MRGKTIRYVIASVAILSLMSACAAKKEERTRRDKVVDQTLWKTEFPVNGPKGKAVVTIEYHYHAHWDADETYSGGSRKCDWWLKERGITRNISAKFKGNDIPPNSRQTDPAPEITGNQNIYTCNDAVNQSVAPGMSKDVTGVTWPGFLVSEPLKIRSYIEDIVGKPNDAPPWRPQDHFQFDMADAVSAKVEK